MSPQIIERAMRRLDEKLERQEPLHVARDRAARCGVDEASEALSGLGERQQPACDVLPSGSPFELQFDRLCRRGFVTPDRRRSCLGEEIRLIKRKLLRDMELPRAAIGTTGRAVPRTLAVTSARPGEGKTFVALNLALSLALDEGIPTVLLEVDYVRSPLCHLLGVEQDPGLTDILIDTACASIGKALRPVKELPLAFLPPGRSVPSATALYSSERMSRLLREAVRLRGEGLVIIDSTSMLSATEAVELAMQAEHVLLVVEAEHTTETALRSALELLAPCERVSVVFNKVPRGAREQFGSYYANGARG